MPAFSRTALTQTVKNLMKKNHHQVAKAEAKDLQVAKAMVEDLQVAVANLVAEVKAGQEAIDGDEWWTAPQLSRKHKRTRVTLPRRLNLRSTFFSTGKITTVIPVRGQTVI